VVCRSWVGAGTGNDGNEQSWQSGDDFSGAMDVDGDAATEVASHCEGGCDVEEGTTVFVDGRSCFRPASGFLGEAGAKSGRDFGGQMRRGQAQLIPRGSRKLYAKSKESPSVKKTLRIILECWPMLAIEIRKARRAPVVKAKDVLRYTLNIQKTNRHNDSYSAEGAIPFPES
jgi:hypothetical protein